MSEQARHRTLAEKLDHLFTTIHPRDRGEYSLQEVCDGIREQGGPRMTANYLWQLRTGLRDNPSKAHLEALGRFFGIDPKYFLDSDMADQIDRELELIVAMRDAGIRNLALRASRLTPEALRVALNIIEQVGQLGARTPDRKEPRR
jgi:transcriptional regulator with XRE-family HTH domain